MENADNLPRGGHPKTRVPIRWNVLILVGSGYVTLLVFFLLMVWRGGMTPESAYEVVKGPLMALIGGSLAISKDLIPLGDSPEDRRGGRPSGPTTNGDSGGGGNDSDNNPTANNGEQN